MKTILTKRLAFSLVLTALCFVLCVLLVGCDLQFGTLKPGPADTAGADKETGETETDPEVTRDVTESETPDDGRTQVPEETDTAVPDDTEPDTDTEAPESFPDEGEPGTDDADIETVPGGNEDETREGIDVTEWQIAEPVTDITLEESSGTYSLETAKQLLTLCTGNTADRTRELMQGIGFSVALQKNYDKPYDDPSHTCAYTVATGTLPDNGQDRPTVVVVIRGTSGGEWYSNFDVSPDRDFDPAYAENFLAAAKDVFAGLETVLKTYTDNGVSPMILVAGHSRGAACANLVGLLLNQAYPVENTYVYTFATPATVRKIANVYDGNIFNFINPCDIVTEMPLYGWGFSRAGTDIILPADSKKTDELKQTMSSLLKIAPNLEVYYNTRYSLKGAGEAEDGMTTFEAVSSICKLLMNFGANSSPTSVSDYPLALILMNAESDLYPFRTAIMGLGTVQEDGTSVAFQHMPTTYYALISSLQ